MSVEKLAKTYEPKVLAALLSAFADVRREATLTDLERLIRAGNYEGALRVIGVDAAAFAVFEQTLTSAYAASGADLASRIPKLKDPITATKVTFRFDVRDARAERYLREHSSTLITRIVNDQRSAIRLALQEGLAAGTNPRQTALDIVGRINPATGRRQGGVIGLNRQQTEFVGNMRAELRDPERMANYFTRELRDKRFDGTVAKALRAGKPLDRETINKLTTRYSDNLLKLRGQTVARTETLNVMREARVESTKQLIDTGRVKKGQVKKIWDSTGDDGRTRDSHLEMEGVAVSIDEPFVLPDGSRLMYPGDSSLGAPASETINCRCRPQIKIDFLAGVL